MILHGLVVVELNTLRRHWTRTHCLGRGSPGRRYPTCPAGSTTGRAGRWGGGAETPRQSTRRTRPWERRQRGYMRCWATPTWWRVCQWSHCRLHCSSCCQISGTALETNLSTNELQTNLHIYSICKIYTKFCLRQNYLLTTSKSTIQESSKKMWNWNLKLEILW